MDLTTQERARCKDNSTGANSFTIFRDDTLHHPRPVNYEIGDSALDHGQSGLGIQYLLHGRPI